MITDAEISPCGRYRYWLRRCWDPGAYSLAFIMLNPSTADASVDDPTIRRCMGFARALKYGGVVVANLFAYRATDPAELRRQTDPIGPENDQVLRRFAPIRNSLEYFDPIVIAAWGAHGSIGGRDQAVVDLITRQLGVPLYALRITKGGHPGHPLYLPADLQPVIWKPAAAGAQS